MSERVVTEIPLEQMTPELRALIAYEPNGSLDVEDPRRAIAKIRDETPVVRWEMGVGFFTMADIVAAGRNPVLVATDPSTGLSFGMGTEDPLIPLHLDGDRHRDYRRLLDPLFTPKKMSALEPSIRRQTDELIDRFAGEGRAELYEALCVPLPSTVFLTLFGMPLEQATTLIGFKDRILKAEGATSHEEMEVKGRAAGRELRAFLRERLGERKRDGGRHDDLLHSFLHFEVDGRGLTDEEVVNIMHMFTIAGLDTVTSSLSCMFAWLAIHPEQRRRLVADPSLLPGAIEELLRIESPVPSSGARWVAEDTEVNGVPLRRGELVYLCWAAANTDPGVFDEAMVADLQRSPNRHIVFASGIHRCLGSHLARNELRVAVDQFHRRIPEYGPDPDRPVEYLFAGVRQAHRLPITFPTAP
jgi:cytochrome P450